MTLVSWYAFAVALLAVVHVASEVIGVRRPKRRIVSPKTGRPVSVEMDAIRVRRSDGTLAVCLRPSGIPDAAVRVTAPPPPQSDVADAA